MRRIFRAARRQGQVVVYDPCSGVTRLAPLSVPEGRCRLEDNDVRTWPTACPSSLGLDVPVSVCWSPLVRCNLACPHCLDDKSVPESGPGSREAAGRLIGASGVLGVDISGGEPLLLRDLPRLAASLAGDGCAVSVTTNGWHLARRARELSAAADAIRVSLDAPDAAGHDALRGTGSFTRALDGIRAAVSAGLPVQIHTVLTATSARRAQELAGLAAGTGASGVTFLQMLPVGEAARIADRAMIDDDTAAAVVAAVRAPGLDIRLRTRDSAEGFTVVRADGRVWRNGPGALSITAERALDRPGALAVSRRDGSA